MAIKVIEELGIDIKNQYPKLINEIPEVDVVVTMGCEINCPIIPNIFYEDWNLDDPSGLGIEEFRKTRNLIIEKSKQLLKKLENI